MGVHIGQNYKLDECDLWRTKEGLVSRNDNLEHYDFKALCKYPINLSIDYPVTFLNKFDTSPVQITANFKSGGKIPFIYFNISDYLRGNGYKTYGRGPLATGGWLFPENFQRIYKNHNYHTISKDDIVTSFEVTMNQTHQVAEVLYNKDRHLNYVKESPEYTDLQRPQTYELIALDIKWNNGYYVTRKVYQ